MTNTIAYDTIAPATTLHVRPDTATRSDSPALLAARIATHLGLASLPVLGISAHVFGWIQLHTLAVDVLLPLAVVVALLATLAPHSVDRLVAVAVGWGIVACAAYDAFRLPTIYLAHWWGDFFGAVGGWAVDGHGTNFAVGYAWRYLGDGGGIAVPFFLVMALLPPTVVTTRRRSILSGVAYGVCPVWSGLIVTDALAPHARQLFPLTPSTFVLSLVGHLIYGSVLGAGWWYSRSVAGHLPFTLTLGARIGRRSNRTGASNQPSTSPHEEATQAR